MRITETVDYRATPDVVFDMFTDVAFQERKCLDAGALRHDAAVTRVADGARIVTRRDLPTDSLPDFAKSLVGTSLSVTETYEWGAAAPDGSRSGELTVEVGGAPLALRAKVGLTPNATGTSLRIDGDLKASIPFLGARVEKSAATAVVDGIRGEGRTGSRWLAERA
ncbi:MAG: DUF2505 domain-containing protein [Micrococcales bacterium]|nr:DUF2505 domain-containing protein [Micrococcales bacterium]